MSRLLDHESYLKLRPTPVERALVQSCQTGQEHTFGLPGDPNAGKLPELGDPNRVIRAEILKYLILGGSDACKVDARGVRISGANIKGQLDISYCEVNGNLKLKNCILHSDLHARQSKIRNLDLTGSKLRAVDLQRAKVEGDVSFHGAELAGCANLSGATIHGQLDFETASLQVKQATPNSQPDGAESRAYAFDGQDLIVEQGLFWRRLKLADGAVDFRMCKVEVLADDDASWNACSRYELDGLEYKRLADAPVNTRQRLNWLARGSNLDGEFYPQPYTQLARALRDTGHDLEARRVLYKREQLLRIAYRKSLRTSHQTEGGKNDLAYLWSWLHPVFADLPQRAIVGYGHHPFRSLMALILLIVLTYFPARGAWEEGSFAPNSALIQNSSGWLVHLNQPNPAEAWASEFALGRDWETFRAVAYAVDVVIPIIDFGQTEAWAPSTNREYWGKFLYWWRWVMTGAGWIVTALGAAAITGIIRRD